MNIQEIVQTTQVASSIAFIHIDSLKNDKILLFLSGWLPKGLHIISFAPLVKYRQNRKPELADMKHIIIHAIALPMTNDLDENKQKRGQQRSSFVSV